MFDKNDILVFFDEDKKWLDYDSVNESIPNHLLSYEHNTWTGYVRANNYEKEDEFANKLKSICRG
jgi:hypothetical protein